jgi:deoxyribose-phosphate aldolase
MADDVNAIVDEITERVRRRLDAFRAGTETPCSASPGTPASTSEAECAPSCFQCPNHDTCGTSLSVRSGLSTRVSPDRLRTSADIAPFIDHTMLKPEATRDEVLKLCDEAKKYGFATVCVNAINVGTAARALAGSSVVPIAVVGFPLGATTPSAKAFETREAVRCGAKEIDMVVNIGALKARDHALVLHDIQLVVNAAKPVPVKVILETSQLTDDEKRRRDGRRRGADAPHRRRRRRGQGLWRGALDRRRDEDVRRRRQPHRRFGQRRHRHRREVGLEVLNGP